MPTNGQAVKIAHYTRSKFNSLTNKDSATIYYVEEPDGKIKQYVGNTHVVSDNTDVVKLTGTQTINGDKSFNRPVVIKFSESSVPGIQVEGTRASARYTNTGATGGVAAAVLDGRIRNTSGNESRVMNIGMYGGANLGGNPTSTYMYLDSMTDGAWNNTTLKVDSQNRIGIAIASSGRPTQALDVNGKIRMRTATSTGDANDIVTTKGYVDTEISNKTRSNIWTPTWAQISDKPTWIGSSKPTYTASEVGAEPAFTKNTAFNKNFGTSAGTVTQGNDSRLSNARASNDVLAWAKIGNSDTIPTSKLPALAITDTFEVATQSAMTTLTAQKGDIAIRTDLNKTFILAAEPASTLGNWKELKTPTDAVLSVAGLTGAIAASSLKTSLGLNNVNNTSDANKPISTAVATALTGKASTSHTHNASEINAGTLPTGRIGDNSIGPNKLSRSDTAGVVMKGLGTIANPEWGTLSVSEITGLNTALNAKAPLASPTFTGTPRASTATSTTNSTQLATTAFVHSNRKKWSQIDEKPTNILRMVSLSGSTLTIEAV